MELNQYLRDGADAQSRAILAFVQELGIDHWDVTRWDYGVEQGYTLYRSIYRPHPDLDPSQNRRSQLNISFYEGSQTNIVVIRWYVSTSFRPPCPDDYDQSKSSFESDVTKFESFDFKGAVDFIEKSMADFG